MARQDEQDNQLLLEALRSTKRGVVTGKTWSDIRQKLGVDLRGGNIRRSANYLKSRGKVFWTVSERSLGGVGCTIYLLRLSREASKGSKNGQKSRGGVNTSAATGGRKRKRR